MSLSKAEERLFNALRVYAETLRDIAAGVIAGRPEDQLKRPVCSLLEAFLPGEVQTRTKTPVTGLGARPDIGAAKKQHLRGYIELKAPGKGANPNRFKGPDKSQWK